MKYQSYTEILFCNKNYKCKYWSEMPSRKTRNSVHEHGANSPVHDFLRDPQTIEKVSYANLIRRISSPDEVKNISNIKARICF